jgi:hypothetical protein
MGIRIMPTLRASAAIAKNALAVASHPTFNLGTSPQTAAANPAVARKIRKQSVITMCSR